MPKPLKIWAIAWLIAIYSSLLIGYFLGFHWTRLLFWTFFQSETAIGGWMSAGYTPLAATIIGTIGGFIAITHHLWLAGQVAPFLKMVWNFQAKEYNSEKGVHKYIMKAPYVALPILSLIPDGGALWSIATSKFFRLNVYASFFLIQLGNITKNVAFGCGFRLLAISNENVGYVATALAFATSIPLVLKIMAKRKSPRN